MPKPSHSIAKVTVSLEGADGLQSRLSTYDLAQRSRFKRLIQVRSLEIMNGAKKRCPVDMGQLRSSIYPVFYDDGLVAEVGTKVGYGAFVEFGTGPAGKQLNLYPLPSGYSYGNGGKFPPIRLILEWVKRKGIKPKGGATPSSLRSLAYLIARSIARRGVKPRPYLFPSFEEVRPKFEADIKNGFK